MLSTLRVTQNFFFILKKQSHSFYSEQQQQKFLNLHVNIQHFHFFTLSFEIRMLELYKKNLKATK